MSDKDQKSSEDLRRELEERFKKFKETTGSSSSDEQTTTDSAASKQETTGSSTNNASSSSSSSNTNKESTRRTTFNQTRTESSNQSSEDNNNNKQQNDNKAKFNFESFKSFFGNSTNNQGSVSKNLRLGGLLGGALVLIGLFASGFYTVNESERGVVTRFGAYHSTTLPGLNWKVPLIDSVNRVNVQRVSELKVDGTMLTRDENVVNVTLTVQYRIDDPVKFLYAVDQPITTLDEATESSLRYVVGHMDMDDVITTGRSTVRENTRQMLLQILDNYGVGIGIVDVNFQSARPPEPVKESFDDAIKAQEDEQRFIREAEAYQRSREPIARGQARQIIATAQGYAAKVIAQANAEAANFQNLLPQFLANPQVFKQRYYLDTMASIYQQTPKVIMQSNNNITFLPLDKLFGNVGTKVNTDNGALLLDPNNPANAATYTNSSSTGASSSSYTPNNSNSTPSATDSSRSTERSPSRTPSRFSTRGGN